MNLENVDPSMSETNLKEQFTDGQNIKREFDIL